MSDKITITAAQLLTNDVGEGLTLTALGPATRGGTVARVGNTITYTCPPLDRDHAIAFDTFTYTTTDRLGQKATATVRVNITNPIRAKDDYVSLTCGGSVVIRDTTLLANDFGFDLSLASVGPADHGTATLRGNAVTYAAPPCFIANTTVSDGPPEPGPRRDRFTYTIVDRWGQTASATIHVSLDGVAPILAEDDRSSVTLGGSRVLRPTDLLNNDDGLDIHIITVSQPLYGTVVWDGETITYTAPGSIVPETIAPRPIAILDEDFTNLHTFKGTALPVGGTGDGGLREGDILFIRLRTQEDNTRIVQNDRGEYTFGDFTDLALEEGWTLASERAVPETLSARATVPYNHVRWWWRKVDAAYLAKQAEAARLTHAALPDAYSYFTGGTLREDGSSSAGQMDYRWFRSTAPIEHPERIRLSVRQVDLGDENETTSYAFLGRYYDNAYMVADDIEGTAPNNGRISFEDDLSYLLTADQTTGRNYVVDGAHVFVPNGMPAPYGAIVYWHTLTVQPGYFHYYREGYAPASTPLPDVEVSGINAAMQITYVLPASQEEYPTEDRFTYTIGDGHGQRATATVRVALDGPTPGDPTPSDPTPG